MTRTIEQRYERRDTHGFVVAGTVDLLAEKTIGIIGDRRMTLMRRYLGEGAGTPRLYPGYRLWHGGFGDAVERRAGASVVVHVAGPGQRVDHVGFRVGPLEETEEQARERYQNPGDQWLGQRRDITFVMLLGWPGEPNLDDRVRIERWNEHGVGEETVVVFDDYDPVQEIGWAVKGDRVRQVQLWDEFCDTHGMHFEHPDHQRMGCVGRQSTLAENLAVLAHLAKVKEQS